MDIFQRVKDYIENSTEFDPILAREVVEFQAENLPLYKKFLSINGVHSINIIEDIPFFPVEIFKTNQILIGEPMGYFESSGTTGQRSRVFYHEKSLELYRVSALKSFPFSPALMVTLVPPFSIASNSSLSYMLKIFEQKFEIIYINSSFEIQDILGVLDRLMSIKGADIVFLTSTQLLKLSEFMIQNGFSYDNEIIIIETGGYKALRRPYIRKELYEIARKAFPKGRFFTEYGMSEMFSQFYTTCDSLYKMSSFAMVFTVGEGLLRVFDFANLFTVSALMVPDRVRVEGRCFDVLGRVKEDEKGCAFTFR